MAFKSSAHPRDRFGRFTSKGTRLTAVGRGKKKLLSKQKGGTTRTTSANLRRGVQQQKMLDAGLKPDYRPGKKLGPGVRRRRSVETTFRTVYRPVTVARRRKIR